MVIISNHGGDGRLVLHVLPARCPFSRWLPLHHTSLFPFFLPFLLLLSLIFFPILDVFFLLVYRFLSILFICLFIYLPHFFNLSKQCTSLCSSIFFSRSFSVHFRFLFAFIFIILAFSFLSFLLSLSLSLIILSLSLPFNH